MHILLIVFVVDCEIYQGDSCHEQVLSLVFRAYSKISKRLNLERVVRTITALSLCVMKQEMAGNEDTDLLSLIRSYLL